MVEKEKSRFTATFRLTPSRSFAGLKLQVASEDGYQFSIHDDMVWIGFDASPDEWQLKLDAGRQFLKTLLSTLTIQVEYPFDLEPIQWIEDKPRDKSGNRNYVLGRLGPDMVAQKQPPQVNNDDLGKARLHVHLASYTPHYRYALLDYSLALSLPPESIVFCARSVDWVQSCFDALKRSLPKEGGLDSRKLMNKELRLPVKYLNLFFKIANDTVIARHTGDPTKIRPPKVEEIRFCVYFSRIVLDRFGGHLWHHWSSKLPEQWRYPEGEKAPGELAEAANPHLVETLKKILSGELS